MIGYALTALVFVAGSYGFAYCAIVLAVRAVLWHERGMARVHRSISPDSVNVEAELHARWVAGL